MFISLIIMIVSFMLDGFLSSYMPYLLNNISSFTPVFTVVGLIIIYPYFYHQDKNYFCLCAIFGILYSIAYTNTLYLYGFIFLLMGLLIRGLNKLMTNNIINTLVITIVTIIGYELITYSLLLIIGYINYNVIVVVYKILKSILMNVIYATIVYFITRIISKRFHITYTN